MLNIQHARVEVEEKLKLVKKTQNDLKDMLLISHKHISFLLFIKVRTSFSRCSMLVCKRNPIPAKVAFKMSSISDSFILKQLHIFFQAYLED